MTEEDCPVLEVSLSYRLIPYLKKAESWAVAAHAFNSGDHEAESGGSL